MKKFLLTVIIFLLTLAVYSQIRPTSSSKDYNNIFKISPAMFTRSTFQMGVEHFINPTTGLYLTAGLKFIDQESESTWGVAGEAQLKFHVYTIINPENSHRLYFAPYIQYQYMNEEYQYWTYPNVETITDAYSAIGTGILFGWSFSFANRINLDIYTGGGLRKAFHVDDRTDKEIFMPAYSGISPRLGFDVGFWF